LIAEIPVRFDRRMASFGSLPGLSLPQPVAVPVTRAQDPDRDKGGRTRVLPVPAPEHDLSLSLRVGPVAGDSVTVGVQVVRASSQQPLSRARVTIQDTEHQALESDLTRENGVVTFHDVAPGRYLIEIKHEGKVFELPITFVREEETSRT
jgi:hypothetical protein